MMIKHIKDVQCHHTQPLYPVDLVQDILPIPQWMVDICLLMVQNALHKIVVQVMVFMHTPGTFICSILSYMSHSTNTNIMNDQLLCIVAVPLHRCCDLRHIGDIECIGTAFLRDSNNCDDCTKYAQCSGDYRFLTGCTTWSPWSNYDGAYPGILEPDSGLITPGSNEEFDGISCIAVHSSGGMHFAFCSFHCIDIICIYLMCNM